MSHTNLYCHLCAEEQPKFRIIENSSNKKQLNEYILRYLPIKINIVTNICMDCANVILNFHTFVKKIERAQLKLRNLVINETIVIKTKPPEFTDETIPLNSFQDYKKSPFVDEEMFLCETNFSSHSEEFEQKINLKSEFTDNNLESNAIEFKQEIDLENQFPNNNLENVLLDSKTTELIDNTSLQNNIIVSELDKEKVEQFGGSKIFQRHRIWECYRCNKSQVKLESLQKHFESVHQAPVEYFCYKCQGLFSDVNGYKRHLSNDHAINLITDNVARFKCKICGFVSNRSANFRRHQLTHTEIKKFKCNVCGRKFALKQTLRAHSLTHKQEFTISSTKDQLPKLDPSLFSYQFKCFECDQTFNKLNNLEKHMKETHKDMLMTYNCPRCDKIVTEKNELVKHLKCDHKRYKCRICDKELKNKTSFVAHYYVHKGIKLFSCDVCGKSFTRKQHAQTHRLQHDQPIFNCDQCDKTFSSEILFQIHQKTHEPKQYEQKLYECDICQKKFVNKYYIAEHKRLIHEENSDSPYVCTKCGKSFKLKGPLVVHEATHVTVNTYHCDKCPKVLKSMYTLRIHKKLHEGIKPFKCDICGMEFKHRCSLTRHTRIHENKMPYECEFCKKSFREKNYLKRHLRQHTGEKPYACLECNHSFSDDGNFRKHLRGRHGLQNFSIINNHQYPFVNQQND